MFSHDSLHILALQKIIHHRLSGLFCPPHTIHQCKQRISNKLRPASAFFHVLFQNSERVHHCHRELSAPLRSPFSILNFVKSILIDLIPSHVVTTVSDYSIDQTVFSQHSRSRERLCNLPTGGHIGELHLLETGVDSTISCCQTFGGLGLNISLTRGLATKEQTE